jgi:hypothetical protein
MAAHMLIPGNVEPMNILRGQGMIISKATDKVNPSAEGSLKGSELFLE